MKTTLTILLSTLTLYTSGQNTWIIQKLQITDSTYSIIDARLKNHKGNILEHRGIEYGSNNIKDWVSKAVFTYDSGKLIRTDLFNQRHHRGKKPHAAHVYQFDENGQKSALTVYNLTSKDSTMSLTKEFNYMADTNLVQEISIRHIDYEGNRIEPQKSISEYRYNDRGQKIEEWTIDSEEVIRNHYSFKYDDHGNLVEKRLLDLIDYLEKTLITYTYNSQGELFTDEVRFNNGQVFRRHKYVYNQVGEIREVLEYCDETDSLCTKVIYEYRKEK